MKKTHLTPEQIRQLEARYRTLAAKMGSFESLSQGSVMPKPPHAWRWTRKVAGKTVSLGLTSEKADQMKQAIDNHRALEKIIHEMREITQKLILETPEITTDLKRNNHPKTALS